MPRIAHLMRIGALFALGCLVSGCAMTKPPLHAESDYPTSWPALASLGSECGNLDGAYANQGTVIDGKGKEHPIQLTSLFSPEPVVETESVSLKVVTRKRDTHGDSFSVLQVTLDDGKTSELKDCFCIKQTLFFKSREEFEILLYPGLVGKQCNVWLTKAADGTLIAKVWNYSVGHVAVVPFYQQKCVWARFGTYRH